jgi:hypothetical protein
MHETLSVVFLAEIYHKSHMERHALDHPLHIVNDDLEVALKNYRFSVTNLNAKTVEIMVSAYIQQTS